MAVLAMAGACGNPFDSKATISVDQPSGAPAEGQGPNDASRSMTAPPAPDPVEYRVTGAGPDGDGFTETYAAMPVDVTGLAAGEWTITVEGLDSSGTVVLHGSTVTMVATDGSTPIQVSLVRPAGQGQVNIDLSWPAALLAGPQIVAVLEPQSGAAGSTIVMDTTIQAADGTATCSATSVPSGWYKLQLKLMDGSTVVSGRAELVEVAADQTTSGTITVAELNKPGNPQTISGTSFTLAWDPSTTTSTTDPVASYNVYYRTHGTYPWTLLGNTGSVTESFEVTTSILAHGSYDFAVTAVAESGTESDPHTSLDNSADPQCGWYVEWVP